MGWRKAGVLTAAFELFTNAATFGIYLEGRSGESVMINSMCIGSSKRMLCESHCRGILISWSGLVVYFIITWHIDTGLVFASATTLI